MGFLIDGTACADEGRAPHRAYARFCTAHVQHPVKKREREYSLALWTLPHVLHLSCAQFSIIVSVLDIAHKTYRAVGGGGSALDPDVNTTPPAY